MARAANVATRAGVERGLRPGATEPEAVSERGDDAVDRVVVPGVLVEHERKQAGPPAGEAAEPGERQ